ncbi:MAG: KOW domain-containing RNA-binding protein [Oscillospiraceae bacterium]|jgi:ribosomal protein L14E/L6E/L27E|nr:KOW domain-containing RNA-binding protein [Oscillospiraceae bacterium]
MNLANIQKQFAEKIKFTKGVVVCSAAGRDKGDFQVIMSTENDFAFVCDGRYRPLEKIKKKNRKHLFFTNTVLEEKDLSTNKLIRKSLAKFIDACKNQSTVLKK